MTYRPTMITEAGTMFKGPRHWWRVEKAFTVAPSPTAWTLFAEGYETRDEAEQAVARAFDSSPTVLQVRVIEYSTFARA